MSDYGLFSEKIYFDDKSYGADIIDPPYANYAGFKTIYAVNGLPAELMADLIRSSQICDVPHTWRIQEFASEDEVTPEIIERGKQVLAKDMEELGAHIITYVGESKTTAKINYQFLAAGAIRNKLNRNYRNDQYPVVSRAIVASKYRRKGLGNLIVEHRLKTILNKYFGQLPKAIHFGTESKQILKAFSKVEAVEQIKFVYIGDESYEASDGIHIVNDYLCFLPWFQKSILAACDILKEYSQSPDMVVTFKEVLKQFMELGVKGISGQELQTSHQKILTTFDYKSYNKEKIENALDLVKEIFIVKEQIGAYDPKAVTLS